MNLLYKRYLLTDFVKENIKILEKNGIEVVCENKPSDKQYNEADIIMTGFLKKDQINKMSKLKAVFVPFTGFDKVDIDVLKEKDIPLFNSHAKAKYVAEKALSLLLSVMGRVVLSDKEMRQGLWRRRQEESNEISTSWRTLYNKRVGIYGYGEIGKRLHVLLKPFNCKINLLTRDVNKTKNAYFYNDLLELCENSDILFVATPLNKNTRNSIGLEHLKALKGYIVNVGRGAIINEDALFTALNNNILEGAGIDVWYNYPKDKKPTNPGLNNDFAVLDNLVMSPHSATDLIEDKDEYDRDIFEQLFRYLKIKI